MFEWELQSIHVVRFKLSDLLSTLKIPDNITHVRVNGYAQFTLCTWHLWLIIANDGNRMGTSAIFHAVNNNDQSNSCSCMLAAAVTLHVCRELHNHYYTPLSQDWHKYSTRSTTFPQLLSTQAPLTLATAELWVQSEGGNKTRPNAIDFKAHTRLLVHLFYSWTILNLGTQALPLPSSMKIWQLWRPRETRGIGNQKCRKEGTNIAAKEHVLNISLTVWNTCTYIYSILLLHTLSHGWGYDYTHLKRTTRLNLSIYGGCKMFIHAYKLAIDGDS